MSVYYATKAYVLSFSEAIAGKLKNTGVIITMLFPGSTQSKVADIKDSTYIVAYSYLAMQKGKQVAINGLVNKLLVWSIRFSPRHLVDWLAERLSKKKNILT